MRSFRLVIPWVSAACAVFSMPSGAQVLPAGDAGGSGASRSEDPRHRLQYVESNAGLNAVLWEGGDTELEFADLNGDGHLEIVTIGDHGNPLIQSGEKGLMVYFGDGAGNWAHQQTGNFGYGGMAIGDVNGDGWWDVGYAMHHNYSSNDFGDQYIEVALGDGTGFGWTPWDDGLGLDGQSWGMFATDFADVDQDGDLDLASNSFGCCDGVHVYRNEGDGTWTRTFGFQGGNADPHCEFGDVDGDGHPDLAVSNSTGTVWRGDGTGSFTKIDGNLPIQGGFGIRSGLDLGDVDLDGDDEIAYVTGSGNLQVWTYDGSETWSSLCGTLPESSPWRLLQICDMDVDGYPDLAAMGSGRLQVWLGDGAGGWTAGAAATSVAGSGISAFRTGADFDHNGFPDVAYVEDQSCGFFCSRNRPLAFAEASRPIGLTAFLASPRGGEVWRGGSVKRVTWYAGVPAGLGSSATVEISTMGTGGPWTSLAAGIPNGGQLQIQVPVGIASPDTWIRVRVQAGGDEVTASHPSPVVLVP